jgi:hypothetical protein
MSSSSTQPRALHRAAITVLGIAFLSHAALSQMTVLGNASGAAPTTGKIGFSIASAGDVDQDGVPDVIVAPDGPARTSRSGGVRSVRWSSRRIPS